MVWYCLVIWIWLLEEKRAWASSEGKWELERLCVVHSSRVHAYFSVIWIYFVFLCGLVQAATLGLHFLFFHILFIYLFWSFFSKDTEGITEEDTGYLWKNTSEISTCRSTRQRRRWCRVSISGGEQRLKNRRKALELLLWPVDSQHKVFTTNQHHELTVSDFISI